MKSKHIFRGAAVSLILGTIVLCTTAFVDKYQHVVRKLSMLESVLNEYYVGDVDTYKLQEGIYKGFISGVGDTYSAYYTQKEYDDFKEEASGIYHGIGIRMYLEAEDNSIVIKEVFEGSPAEEAGLLPNDKIIKVAGKNVSGNDYTIVSSLVAGEKDTEVEMTIFRPSDKTTYEFTLTRGNITYPTVNFRMIDDEVAYIQITKFEELTHSQFKTALEKSEAQNAKGIVLDLRNNPGGLLRIAKDIVDELIPEGIIVSTKDKNGKSVEYYADNQYTDIPMVVLINSRSASASEVVAGALKDYGRAKMVGETSYGKGVVQTVIPLSDGSALKLTTSQYFTPSGVCIQGIGIEPDVQIGLPIEKLIRGSNLEDTEDDQLQTAIKVLRQEISE
ncbi:MAG: S41 family peptidase [Candidatus Cellulosilyticum pullistercoris]|uniref:S41 family peptidase n=1 Tax=Candidatus Cellulosilyticum pullistercoris TaxID=2838521 RepID=A0A9E2KD50_9FIRM|nr:S41 family peptidase [Candidatus Cellulosilyticum pullistercoris]